MPSIFLASPLPNDTVTRRFFVTGSATLDADVDCQISVLVKAQNGALIAGQTLMINFVNRNIPWQVEFTAAMITGDFPDCDIVAELRQAGSLGPPVVSGVGGVDINGGNGGVLLMP